MARRESCFLILMKMAMLLIILVAALIAGFFYVKDRLNEYFNRGDTIEVPDFCGKHLVQVFKEKPADLELEKRDEKYDARYPRDHVVAQYPEAGTRVRVNKKIFLTISLGNKQVKVPDLIQRSLRETDLALLNAQLIHGNRVYIPSDQVPKDRIITQSPLPGETNGVQEGVDMVISLGPRRLKIPLPSLVGKSLDEGKNSLTAWGLRPGQVFSKKDTGRPRLEILGTDPTPFEPVSEGTAVNLLLSAGDNQGNATWQDLRKFEFYEDLAAAGKEIQKEEKPAATPKPEPPRILFGDPGTGIAPPVTPSLPTPDPVPETPTQVVSFLMPDGFMPKEVKFVQVSPAGREQIYAATHKPNDLIKVKVPKVAGSKVHIYINNVPIEERSIE